MASDGRYMYPPSDVPAPYSYPHYTASQYDPAQYQQNPPRSIRGTPSQSQSPHHPQAPQPPYNPPPATYPAQPPYAAPSYSVTPAPNPPWTAGETWPYPQSYAASGPPLQDPQSYNATNGRSEAPTNPPGEHRAQQPAGPSKPDPPRGDVRSPRPTEAAPQSKVRKTSEGPPSLAHAIPTSLMGLDFVKLLDSYRLIIDSTSALSADPAHGRPVPINPTAEDMGRVLQAAAYGAHALESALKRAVPATPRAPSERLHEDSDGSASKTRQKNDQSLGENQTCLGCNATSTPEWRRGPMGPRTLCNACGLVYAKLIKKRTRETGRSRGVPHCKQGDEPHHDGGGHPSSVDGGSDDDDSYGRRSEGRD